MRYLTENDFKGAISAGTLTLLRGTADANLAAAETNAISELDPLSIRYDIDAELAKTSTDRNTVMIRIMISLTVYWLYNTVMDVEIPERVSDNYKAAIRDIELFAAGKKATSLTAKTDSTTGETVTRFEYGFDAKRSNNPFN